MHLLPQVGALMIENLLDINWADINQAVPAFLTISLIPMTYSIAYGVIAGLGSYIFLYLSFLLYDLTLAALGWSDQTVRDVLLLAVPDAFIPEEQ